MTPEETEEIEECPVCADEPCTCFEGVITCTRCCKVFNKYNRYHTCNKGLPANEESK